MDKNIVAFIRDDVKTIGVRFFQDRMKEEGRLSSLELGNKDELTLSGREYTYLTDLDVEVGNLVAVYAVGVPKVVMVTSVHEELAIEPNESIEYKWVIGKIDMQAYIDNCKKNAEIQRTLASAYKSSMRNQFRNVVMSQIDEASQAKLLSILGDKK